MSRWNDVEIETYGKYHLRDPFRVSDHCMLDDTEP